MNKERAYIGIEVALEPDDDEEDEFDMSQMMQGMQQMMQQGMLYIMLNGKYLQLVKHYFILMKHTKMRWA